MIFGRHLFEVVPTPRHHKMPSTYHFSSKNHYEVGTTSNKISTEYHISSKNHYEVGTTSNKISTEYHISSKNHYKFSFAWWHSTFE
jgi:hypothetical protein